jgi:hypothetical protein
MPAMAAIYPNLCMFFKSVSKHGKKKRGEKGKRGGRKFYNKGFE